MNANSKQPAPTIKDWLQIHTAALAGAGIPSARLDAEVLLAHTLGVHRSWLRAHDDETADLTQAEDFIARRLLREPIAYIIGYKEFYGRDFLVTHDTLIPRPETEALIELAKKHDLHGKIIDIGAGSGCLGITLALETESELYASDVSQDALEIAMQNATRLDVRATFAPSSLLERWDGYEFDVIAANLPYVNRDWERSPETDHEPALALFAEDNGLELIHRLIKSSPLYLTQHGWLLLEADPEQHPAIIESASSHFDHVETDGYGVLLRLKD